MRNKIFIFILFLSFSAFAQNLEDGSVLKSHEFRNMPPFPVSAIEQKDVYLSKIKLMEELLKSTSVSRITYASDNFKVTGFVLQPQPKDDKKYPVIVFSHGGDHSNGRVAIDNLPWLEKFVKKGFMVVVPQYRGVDGGEGRDQFGGDDVNDVINILEVLKTLKGADTDNVFSIGHSRGGMMTYLTTKRLTEKGGMQFKAIAVLAGECDLLEGLVDDKDFERVYEDLIPGYHANKEDALKRRSACEWPDKIPIPVFILHAKDDHAVEFRQATMMERKLKQAGNSHVKVKTFDSGGHMVFFNNNYADETVNEIADFFKKYGSASPGLVPTSNGTDK